MSEQETSWKIQDGPAPCGPWVSIENEKRGLILFRLRVKGGFNLVSRMWKNPLTNLYRGSDFLEGIIDTNLGLEWGEDIDVRKKLSLTGERMENGKSTT